MWDSFHSQDHKKLKINTKKKTKLTQKIFWKKINKRLEDLEAPDKTCIKQFIGEIITKNEYKMKETISFLNNEKTYFFTEDDINVYGKLLLKFNN